MGGVLVKNRQRLPLFENSPVKETKLAMMIVQPMLDNVLSHLLLAAPQPVLSWFEYMEFPIGAVGAGSEEGHEDAKRAGAPLL